MFDLGLRLFDAEKIGIVLTEIAENLFVGIILIVSLIIQHYDSGVIYRYRCIDIDIGLEFLLSASKISSFSVTVLFTELVLVLVSSASKENL